MRKHERGMDYRDGGEGASSEYHGIGDWKCPLCFGFQSSDDVIARRVEWMMTEETIPPHC